MVDHGLTMVSWWSDHGQMMVNHGLTANMSQGIPAKNNIIKNNQHKYGGLGQNESGGEKQEKLKKIVKCEA